MAHNVIPKLQSKIKINTKKADTARNQPLTAARPAWLGDNSGVMFTYNGQPVPTGYVVVRDASGNLSVALNSGPTAVSTSVPGIAIWVGYEPLMHPNLFQVLGQRDTYSQQPALSLQNHHTTHEFPNSDTVHIHDEQILNALIRGDNGFILTIYPWFCSVSTGGWVFIPFQTLNMSSYQPTSGAQAFTICAQDAGTIAVVSGTTAATPELITAADFAPPPNPTYHAMWAVRLYSGQTVINQSLVNTTVTPDLYNLRSPGNGGVVSGSYLFAVVSSPGTYSLPAATGSKAMRIIKNTSSGTVTVSAHSGDTIDLETSQTLSPFDSMSVIDNASGAWLIV